MTDFLSLLAFSLALKGGIVGGLELASGVFSLILFGLSIYSWMRRRHYALIVFSAAFLTFFIKTLVDEVIPLAAYLTEVIGASLNFVILALFFVQQHIVRDCAFRGCSTIVNCVNYVPDISQLYYKINKLWVESERFF